MSDMTYGLLLRDVFCPFSMGNLSEQTMGNFGERHRKSRGREQGEPWKRRSQQTDYIVEQGIEE